jgi:hypothetical protein
MGRAWTGWTPFALAGEEVESFRIRILDEVPPATLFTPWKRFDPWWQFQVYPLAAAGVEDTWWKIPPVCSTVILVSGWMFSPGLQHGSVLSQGMQTGQTGKAGQ